jgi:DNA-directed RNA polymerase specialized sigma24 family protein
MLSTADSSSSAEVLDNILNDSSSVRADLQRVFSRGVRLLLFRHFPADVVEDKYQEVFAAAEQAIQDGEFQDPAQLTAFIRAAVKTQINGAVRARPTNGHRAAGIMADILRNLSERDREAFTRFFLHGQDEPRICDRLRMSVEEFQQLKAKVKKRFMDLLS